MARADRMTALDAAFHHLERSGQLLHVGGVYTVEGRVDFDRLTADITARLPLIPRYTQRALSVPLHLAHPTWERDPRFDIANHVVRHRLRAPGDDAQLTALASRLFAQKLDRRHPLWELHLVDGYRGDRSALVAKVHHCMIDGVSGVELMQVMFDVTPEPVTLAMPEPLPPARPLPSASVQVWRAVEEGARAGVEQLQALWALLREPQRLVEQVNGTAALVNELLRLALTPIADTPWNGHVSVLRRVGWATLALPEMKAIKNRIGGTVNDVVLATITAALRRYLHDRGVRIDRLELRAMLPVNVRLPSEKRALGNRVSAMLVPLPVGIVDPRERYRQVCAATDHAKRGGEAVRMSRTLDLMALLPPIVQVPLGWLQMQGAPINTICTNVPGPPVSLYVQGQRLETLVPLVPLAQGVGLAFAMLSYAEAFTIGITADPALVPDVDRIADLLLEAFDEVRGLAGIDRAAPRGVPVRPERKRRPALASAPRVA